MTRFALTANQDASELPHVPYVILVEMDFASGFVRANSSDRYFTHQGNEFAPFGTLASIGPVRENGDLSPEKLEFQLSGVDNSLITVTLTEDYHGRDVRVWVGSLGETMQLVTTPELIWEGLMDVMTIRTEQNESIISVIAENRLLRWNDAADWLYTQEHQRLYDATDDFLNQVAIIQNKEVKWGEYALRTREGGGGPTPPGRRPRPER